MRSENFGLFFEFVPGSNLDFKICTPSTENRKTERLFSYNP